jgi:hypothetical protein
MSSSQHVKREGQASRKATSSRLSSSEAFANGSKPAVEEYHHEAHTAFPQGAYERIQRAVARAQKRLLKGKSVSSGYF